MPVRDTMEEVAVGHAYYFFFLDRLDYYGCIK